jgi:hypothetical protein
VTRRNVTQRISRGNDGWGVSNRELHAVFVLRQPTTYVKGFTIGDFDSVRAMLADDVKLDLVAKLRSKERANPKTILG